MLFPVSEAMSQLLCLDGRGGAALGCFPNSLSNCEESATILSLGQINPSVCVCSMRRLHASIGSVLGGNPLFSLPLGLSAIELYTFQDLSSALLVRRAERHSPQRMGL